MPLDNSGRVHNPMRTGARRASKRDWPISSCCKHMRTTYFMVFLQLVGTFPSKLLFSWKISLSNFHINVVRFIMLLGMQYLVGTCQNYTRNLIAKLPNFNIKYINCVRYCVGKSMHITSQRTATRSFCRLCIFVYKSRR